MPRSVSKRQLMAFPPEEGLQEMWAFRDRKVSGKDSKGNPDGPVMRPGQFVRFETVNMAHYNTIPQLTPLKAPK